MTDLETLRAMLDRTGVKYTTDSTSICIEAGAGPKNDGYAGFATELEFTPEGALDAVGAWE